MGRVLTDYWKRCAHSGVPPVTRIDLESPDGSDLIHLLSDWDPGNVSSTMTGILYEGCVSDASDVGASVNITTLEGSDGQFTFRVARDVWEVILDNFNDMKAWRTTVFAGWKGCDDYVRVYKGYVRDYPGDGDAFLVRVDGLLSVLDSYPTAVDRFSMTPTFPGEVIKLLLAEILDSGDYSPSSLTPANNSSIANFVVSNDFILSKRSPPVGARVNASSRLPQQFSPQSIPMRGQVRALDEPGKECKHLASLMLGSLINVGGAVEFKSYTQANNGRTLTENESTFKQLTSTENKYNQGTFKHAHIDLPESVDHENLEEGLRDREWYGVERLGTWSVGDEILDLPAFESHWVNGISAVPWSELGEIKDFTERYSSVPGGGSSGVSPEPGEGDWLVLGLVPSELTNGVNVGLFTSGRWFHSHEEPSRLSGICGIAWEPSLQANVSDKHSQLANTSSNADRPTFLRLLNLRGDTEIIAVQGFNGDENYAAGDLIEYDGVNDVSSHYDIFADIGGESQQRFPFIRANIIQRAARGSTEQNWEDLPNAVGSNTRYTIPIALDITIPAKWLDTVVPEFRYGVATVEVESPLYTLDIELLDTIDIDSQRVVLTDEQTTNLRGWRVVEERIDLGRGKITRILAYSPTAYEVSLVDDSPVTVSIIPGDVVVNQGEGDFTLDSSDDTYSPDTPIDLSGRTDTFGMIYAAIIVYESGFQGIVEAECTYDVSSGGAVTLSPTGAANQQTRAVGPSASSIDLEIIEASGVISLDIGGLPNGSRVIWNIRVEELGSV